MTLLWDQVELTFCFDLLLQFVAQTKGMQKMSFSAFLDWLHSWFCRSSSWWQRPSSQHPAHCGATRWQGQHHQPGIELRPLSTCWGGGGIKADAGRPCLWGPVVPEPGHPPPTIYLLFLLCPRTLLPNRSTPEDSVRNTRKRKALPHVMKKKRKKHIQTLLILALLTALCFYIIHSLCHQFFQCFCSNYFSKEGSGQTKLC